jgi:predicted ATPase
LVVEDFQWADAASVELLHALVDRVDDSPLLLVLVARPSAPVDGFSNGKVNLTVLELQSLTVQDSERLLDTLLGSLAAPLPSDLRELLTRRAAGNPFVLEEAIRSLLDTGVLEQTPTGARFSGDVTKVEIPTTVQGIILSRWIGWTQERNNCS